MKICTLLALLAYGATLSANVGTVIQKYTLLYRPQNNSKILILSTETGPVTAANIHRLALNTFIRTLMFSQEPIDLITEEATSIEKSGGSYRSYFERYQTGPIKFAANDFRDKIDADLLTTFSLVIKEIENLLEQKIIANKDQWPSSDFFETDPAYNIMKDHLCANTPQLLIQEFLEHLEEQSTLLCADGECSLLPQMILKKITGSFIVSKQSVEKYISDTARDTKDKLIDFIFSQIEHAQSIKDIEQLFNTFIEPSTIVAQAGFLQGILTSQEKKNHTIFFAHTSQTKVIINYLEHLGYQSKFSVPLIRMEEKKIITLDVWSLINLLMHSFVPIAKLEHQRELFDRLIEQASTHRSFSSLLEIHWAEV